MARMIPTRVPSGRPQSERAVFAALETLPGNWTVLYSVQWQSERRGREGDGEADFVLLHEQGLLVVEVKGGEIRIVDGTWVSKSRDGGVHEIRNPFEQAVDSRKALVRYLEDRVPGLRIASGHGVAFPAIRVERDLGPAGPRAIILDRQDLDAASAAVQRLFRHWSLNGRLATADIGRIVGLIALTTEVRPLLRDVVAEVNRELVSLTDGQIHLLTQLRRNRRMLIYGSAGTGKTILAAERARQLARDGFDVLLLCFNRPLANHLAQTLADTPRVRAASFHAFCRDLATSAGERIPANPPQAWWDYRLPEGLPEYAKRVGYQISAMVVDEGQDFAPDWWVSLQLLLKDPDEAPLYVFVDAAQQIYRPQWEAPFPGPVMDLEVNCRNTIQIAQRVAAVFGAELPTLGVSGPTPMFLVASTDDQIEDRLRQLITTFLRDGKLRADQVVILSTSRNQIDGLRGRDIEGIGLVAPGEEGVVTETVHRFKGLEADIVILLLPQLRSDQDRALAYIGMSRARAQLTVMGPKEVKAALAW
jgi:hypothetical protein